MSLCMCCYVLYMGDAKCHQQRGDRGKLMSLSSHGIEGGVAKCERRGNENIRTKVNSVFGLVGRTQAV